MFNTYQELADRIDELLSEREKLQKRIKRLEGLYSKVPQRTINDMYHRGDISREERIYWAMLKLKEEKNEKEGTNR